MEALDILSIEQITEIYRDRPRQDPQRLLFHLRNTAFLKVAVDVYDQRDGFEPKNPNPDAQFPQKARQGYVIGGSWGRRLYEAFEYLVREDDPSIYEVILDYMIWIMGHLENYSYGLNIQPTLIGPPLTLIERERNRRLPETNVQFIGQKAFADEEKPIISSKFEEFVGLYSEFTNKLREAGRPTAPQHLKEESKLDNAELAPIFEGELDRDAMAEALSAAMEEQGLSLRGAATAASVGKNDIQRIGKGTATLDKAAEVLSNLGYELHVEVRKADLS